MDVVSASLGQARGFLFVRRLAVSLSSVLLSACGSDSNSAAQSSSEASFVPLVDADTWSEVSRASDPFITSSDAPAACSSSAHRSEALGLELDTTECNWITLRAPVRFAVRERQRLHVVASHFDLSAETPTRARFELRLLNCTVWSRTIDVPGEARVYDDELDAPCSASDGDAMWLHVDNHGQNTYQLQAIEVLR